MTTHGALLEHPYYVSMAAEGGRRTGVVGRISSPQMRYGYKDWVGYVVDGDTQCIWYLPRESLVPTPRI